MTNAVYLYRFSEAANMPDVTSMLLLAVTAAEALHGRAKVNLEADFELNEGCRTCRIDATRGVGRDIARIFVEYLSLEVGEDKFTVEQGVGASCRHNGTRDDECHCRT